MDARSPWTRSRGWVDTGIDVRRGDILSIQATGTVTLSTNASDMADPGGLADEPARIVFAAAG